MKVKAFFGAFGRSRRVAADLVATQKGQAGSQEELAERGWDNPTQTPKVCKTMAFWACLGGFWATIWHYIGVQVFLTAAIQAFYPRS